MSQKVKIMAKKDILNGFKLKILPEVSNGLIIPTGNESTQRVEQIPSSFVKPNPPPKINSPFSVKFRVDAKAFTPMTNIVPTIEDVAVPNVKTKSKGLSRRARQRVTQDDLDLTEFAAQPTLGDKIVYLSVRGWSVKERERGNCWYRFATKYLWKDRDGKPKLEKKSIYLGSVNKDLSESITIKSFSI